MTDMPVRIGVQTLLRVVLATQIKPDLSESEEIEVIDQERADQDQQETIIANNP